MVPSGRITEVGTGTAWDRLYQNLVMEDGVLTTQTHCNFSLEVAIPILLGLDDHE